MTSKKQWKTLDSAELYTVGWIAALPLERAAALVILDERHNKPRDFVPNQNDKNSYSWGRIGDHNVAVTSLPEAEYGKGSAAVTASGLLSSLPHIRIGLLVGIGAGVPEKDDILLGDVVVSNPDRTNGGVVQYDLYKAKRDGDSGERERKGFLNSPPRVLRAALSALRAEHEISGSEICQTLVAFQNNENTRISYGFPGVNKDYLRKDLTNPRLEPAIHYGTIASGDTLIKTAVQRDELLEWLRNENIHPLCFEMEAAGLMNSFPCLVIRGICDYADEHKDDTWQRYAASIAATFAKELLGYIDNAEVTMTARISEVLEGVNRLRDDIDRGLSNIQSDIASNRALSQLKSALRVARGATYDSHQDEHFGLCLEGTRKELLEQITAWTNDPDGKCIFWLCGKAGTGKSTISRTIGHILDKTGRLGASFFFKRGEGNRSNASCFVSTIVRQLVDKIPDAATSIMAVLEADSLLCERGLQKQFDNLLLEPFSSLLAQQVPAAGLVIIIDALDECERSSDIHQILRLLSQVSTISPLRLQIFVTSRPELPLQLGFQQIDGSVHQDILLEEVQATTIERDIRKYFVHQFDEIRKTALIRNLAPLPLSWPGDDKLDALVDLAAPLFIFAVTVCRYVSDSDSEERLKAILQQRRNAPLSGLGRMYMPILQDMVLGYDLHGRKQALTDFQRIVGAIVLLYEPLSVASLSTLLGDSIRQIGHTLSGLHSLLHISYDGPIRLLHLSFRDFLIECDDIQAGDFHINETQTHARLADHCLTLLEMSKILKPDICGLGNPGIRRTEVNRQKIDDCIPPDLAYACSYWIIHVRESEEELYDGGRVHQFLQLRFLGWLEALVWLGRFSDGVSHITQLRLLVKGNKNPQISAFLDDALRFILNARYIIDLAPLQLYHSALFFAPTNTIIRQTFLPQSRTAFSLLPEASSYWTAEVLRFEGKQERFGVVAFSADGTSLASASEDYNIIVWDTNTGWEIHTLEGHTDWISAVVFSPTNDKLLASASNDMTVRIWDISIGKELQVLRGHTNDVRGVVFHFLDANLLTSVSADRTVRVWNVNTGRQIRVLEHLSIDCSKIVFSCDGQFMAARSFKTGTLQLWDMNTFRVLQNIEPGKGWIAAMAFSGDNKLFAFTLGDGLKIKIYDVITGQIVRLYMVKIGVASSMVFSYDSKLLALALKNHSIGLLEVDIGEIGQILEGHTDQINDGIAFLPHERMLASSSYDGTVRLWDVTIKKPAQTFRQHKAAVSMLKFSVDGKLLASMVPYREEAFLWDTSTGQMLWNYRMFSPDPTMLVLAHSGEGLLAVAEKRIIALINTRTGKGTCMGPADRTPIRALAFSPEVKLLASGSDNAVTVWETFRKTSRNTNDRGLERLQILEEHDSVRALSFSPDGKLLASSTVDGILKIWETSTWKEVLRFERHNSKMNSATFSPYVKLLTSASGDQDTIIWNELEQPDHILLTEDRPLGIHQASVSPNLWNGSLNCPITVEKDWLQWQGQDLLWLPHEYRNAIKAFCNNIVAFGQRSGRVSFLKITPP